MIARPSDWNARSTWPVKIFQCSTHSYCPKAFTLAFIWITIQLWALPLIFWIGREKQSYDILSQIFVIISNDSFFLFSTILDVCCVVTALLFLHLGSSTRVRKRTGITCNQNRQIAHSLCQQAYLCAATRRGTGCVHTVLSSKFARNFFCDELWSLLFAFG